MQLGHALHDVKTEHFDRQEAEMDALTLEGNAVAALVIDDRRVWLGFPGVRTLQVTV